MFSFSESDFFYPVYFEYLMVLFFFTCVSLLILLVFHFFKLWHLKRRLVLIEAEIKKAGNKPEIKKVLEAIPDKGVLKEFSNYIFDSYLSEDRCLCRGVSPYALYCNSIFLKRIKLENMIKKWFLGKTKYLFSIPVVLLITSLFVFFVESNRSIGDDTIHGDLFIGILIVFFKYFLPIFSMAFLAGLLSIWIYLKNKKFCSWFLSFLTDLELHLIEKINSERPMPR